MLECAIVSLNLVLNGFTEGTPKTPEGWGIFRSYDESEPGHVFEAPAAEAETAGPAEA